MKRVSIKVLTFTVAFVFVISGCVGPQKRRVSQDDFNQKVDSLIQQVKVKLKKSAYEFYPAFVTAESMIKGKPYTELEAHFVNKIKNKVPNKYRELSRQNWFELRENSPLTLDEPSLNIFVVHINRNKVSNSAYVYVSMRGLDGKEVIRNVGEIEKLDYGAGSIARAMDTRSVGLPLPEGMPEKPYMELEKFAYGLTKELVERYKKTKPQADQETVADREIKVYIDTEAEKGIPSGLIGKAVRDRLLEAGSFNCTFDRRDFKRFLERIAHYQKHGSKAGGIVDVSEFRNLNIQPASIYLTIDMSSIANNYRVSMRALWMSNPTDTETDGIIQTNLAGMYIAPFFGLAYVDRRAFDDGQAVSIQGRWEVRDLPNRTISGFYEIKDVGRGSYQANKFGSDGISLQRQAVEITLNGNNVYWTYYDRQIGRTVEVRGVLLENGKRMSVSAEFIPSRGAPIQWELVLVE